MDAREGIGALVSVDPAARMGHEMRAICAGERIQISVGIRKVDGAGPSAVPSMCVISTGLCATRAEDRHHLIGELVGLVRYVREISPLRTSADRPGELAVRFD